MFCSPGFSWICLRKKTGRGGETTVEKAIVIIQSGGDEVVNEGFGGRWGEKGAEPYNVFQVKEGRSGKLGDVVVQGQVGVKVDTQL